MNKDQLSELRWRKVVEQEAQNKNYVYPWNIYPRPRPSVDFSQDWQTRCSTPNTVEKVDKGIGTFKLNRSNFAQTDGPVSNRYKKSKAEFEDVLDFDKENSPMHLLHNESTLQSQIFQNIQSSPEILDAVNSFIAQIEQSDDNYDVNTALGQVEWKFGRQARKVCEDIANTLGLEINKPFFQDSELEGVCFEQKVDLSTYLGQIKEEISVVKSELGELMGAVE